MREPPGMEICLRVGAADGAAAPPKAAGRFGGVVGARFARARRSRQGEEGTGFSERRAQRRRAAAVADEIEQVAMFRGGRVGPFSRYAGAGEADEQRAPLGAVAVAGDPVSPLFAALRQITAAHLFGANA